MTDLLDGINAKIERAEKHLYNFTIDAARFERSAYTTRIERDFNAGVIRLFAINMGLLEPPLPLMLLAGEIAYQLRSALDHIIFILAKETAEWSRQFPIFDTVKAYKAKSPGMIKGMSPRALAIVESVQPYRRGGIAEDAHQDPLWMLHRINITDKHQVIPGCIVTTSDVRVHVKTGSRRDVHLLVLRDSCEDGAELGKIRLPDLNVDVNTETICMVSFTQIADTKYEPIVPFFSSAICHVKDIIERFVGEF